MSKRSDTTWQFTCDASGCKATMRDTIDSPRGWLTVKAEDGWSDCKEKHFCIEHKDAILLVLGMAKPKTVTTEDQST